METSVVDDYQRLVRKEITPAEYVARVKKDVNRRLGISPSRYGRAGRRHYGAAE
jgi:hypothetical protein